MSRSLWITAVVALSLLTSTVADAGVVEDAVAATTHSADRYVAAFDNADLAGLSEIGPPPPITGDIDLDDRIRQIAEARGYKRRPEPSRPLVAVGRQMLQPEAAEGWNELRIAAAEAGHTIWITSAYRPVSTQIRFLLDRIGNASDASIDHALSTVAAPGYSRHHTGYTIDMRSSTADGFEFRNSPAYEWLATDSFANAKAHGWLPSYPEGASQSGPIPEPWEFVWVGSTNIICGDYEATPSQPFCDLVGSDFESDIDWLETEGITEGCRRDRFCPNGILTHAQASTMIWRLAGSPMPDPLSTFFVDVPGSAYYSDPVAWMIDNAFTTGSSPSTFSPDHPVTRAEFVDYLWRFAGRPSPGEPMRFDDVDVDGPRADAISWAARLGITRGTAPFTFAPDAITTRGQAAAFLRRFSEQSNPT